MLTSCASLSRRGFVGAAGATLAVSALGAGAAAARAEGAALVAGTYTVTVPSIKGAMTVAVSFSEDAITDVHVLSCVDTPVIRDAAIDSVTTRIVEQQNVEVDGVAGATMTSNAIKAAVCQAVEMAGGNVADFEKGSDAVVDKPEGAEEEFDIVVIGAGAAGISAAITATRDYTAEEKTQGTAATVSEANADIPSVLLLEKQAFVGGCYRVCGGGICVMGAPVNGWIGKDCTTEELVDFMQWRSGDNEINAELWGNVRDISADVFMHMWANGVSINPLGSSWGHPDSKIPVVWTARHNDIAWEDVVSGWSDEEIKIADRQGVDIRLNSAAVELIHEGPVVTGVKVEDLEKVYTVKAKKVIIATGGFTQNAELRAEYAPEFEPAFAFTSAGDDGDAITMTRELDVPVVGEGMMGLIGTNPAHGYYDELGSLCWFPQVYVNAEGESIDIPNTYYGDTLALLCEQTGGCVYGLFDATSPVADRLEKAVDAGMVTKYDTLDELISDQGIAVEATVAACEGTVAEAPFYCLVVRPLFIGSIPGLKVDAQCRVLNSADEVIENLYAAGMCVFGNLFHKQYCSSGTGVGGSHYLGAIAARDALATL